MAHPFSEREAHTRRESRALLIGGALILLVAIFFAFRAYWVGRTESDAALEATPTEIPETATLPLTPAKMLQEKLQKREAFDLLDIRTREAYDLEHIPRSVSVTLTALSSFVPADPKRPIVLVASGADEASLDAARNILSQKSLEFSFLEGGFEGWKSGGYQTIVAGDPNSFVDQSKVTYLSPDELKKRLQAGENLILLDVQSAANFKRSHLVGAINIPLDELEKRRGDIPLGRELVVYGENELASFQGGVRLSDLQFFSVRTLTGNDHLSATSPLFREP